MVTTSNLDSSPRLQSPWLKATKVGRPGRARCQQMPDKQERF